MMSVTVVFVLFVVGVVFFWGGGFNSPNVSVISSLLTSSNKRCDLLRCGSDPSVKDEMFENHLLMSGYSKNKATGLTVPRRGVYTPLPLQNRRPFNKGHWHPVTIPP